MRPHLNEHCFDGSHLGTVPPSYLQTHHLKHCSFCHGLIHVRYHNTCPSCREASQALNASAAIRAQLSQATQQALDTTPSTTPLPSLEDIHSRFVPVARHVPKELRGLWARCLARTMAATVVGNSESSWAELQMLTKCTLCNPPRAGKGHASQRAAFTRRRLGRWLAGERASLWNDLPTYSPPRAKRTSAEADKNRRAVRCIELCREGGYSVACKALTKEPPLGRTATVHRRLATKHPPNSNLPGLSSLTGPRGVAPSLDRESVEQAVRSFHKLSGAGPSGLKPLHLKEALVEGLRDEVLSHLTSLVQLLAEGQVPRTLAPYLAGASLSALPKKKMVTSDPLLLEKPSGG